MTLNYINDANDLAWLDSDSTAHATLATAETTYATIHDAHSIVAPVRDSIFELSDRVRIMGVDFEDLVKSLTDLSMASQHMGYRMDQFEKALKEFSDELRPVSDDTTENPNQKSDLEIFDAIVPSEAIIRYSKIEWDENGNMSIN